MLNYLWAGMILIGIIFAAFTGRMPDITNAAIDSSKEAITLCITMMGVMSFWVGLMEIATKAGIASNEMCTFLIINISSLQLIPVNVIAYRSQYGSVNPAAIVGAGIISTAISTAVAVIYCKIMDRS